LRKPARLIAGAKVIAGELVTFPLAANSVETARAPPDDPPDPHKLLAEYAGGVMPQPLAAFVRSQQRGGGITQERLAGLMGLSRPQLANALALRFGLSEGAADRLRAALVGLPQQQGSLL